MACLRYVDGMKEGNIITRTRTVIIIIMISLSVVVFRVLGILHIAHAIEYFRVLLHNQNIGIHGISPSCIYPINPHTI